MIIFLPFFLLSRQVSSLYRSILSIHLLFFLSSYLSSIFLSLPPYLSLIYSSFLFSIFLSLFDPFFFILLCFLLSSLYLSLIYSVPLLNPFFSLLSSIFLLFSFLFISLFFFISVLAIFLSLHLLSTDFPSCFSLLTFLACICSTAFSSFLSIFLYFLSKSSLSSFFFFC